LSFELRQLRTEIGQLPLQRLIALAQFRVHLDFFGQAPFERLDVLLRRVSRGIGPAAQQSRDQRADD
jgi:hypothetical protein